MAKDKDRALNPAAAQRKAEKQKALKKGKAAVAAQRNERLATRNPHRLESQIAELHALRDSQGGNLKPREKKQLEDLEREITRIKKARETLGDRAPRFGGPRTGGEDRGAGRRDDRSGGGHSSLGKRRRQDSDSETTDEDVRRIPWPRDTPPPIPRQPPRQQPLRTQKEEFERAQDSKVDTSLPTQPPAAAAKTTYESKAQVRDLRKEATKAFMPNIVKRKIEAVKGKGPGGRLLEEEEVERLEGEGYRVGGQRAEEESFAAEAEDAETKKLRDEEEALARDIAADTDGGGGERDEAMQVDRVMGRKQGILQAMVEEVSDEDG